MYSSRTWTLEAIELSSLQFQTVPPEPPCHGNQAVNRSSRRLNSECTQTSWLSKTFAIFAAKMI